MAQNSLGPQRLVVIGGSAGSLEIVLSLVAALPPLPHAAVVVVLHRKQSADSVLTGLLMSRTRLPVKEVEDKEPLMRGHIYLAPPDYHLLLENKEQFSLDDSEKVHHSRPSIDVTFESAVQVFGAGTIGILLSGANADGAAGLQAIRASGGTTLVQDPATAEVYYMPQQALLLDAGHRVVPGAQLPQVLLEHLQP
jgi:two-component system chemotaxis response regulator CheB